MSHRITASPGKALALATAEARKRWGAQAAAWHPTYEVPGGTGYCCVGLVWPDRPEHRWEVYGLGATFAEAFQDAEERGH